MKGTSLNICVCVKECNQTVWDGCNIPRIMNVKVINCGIIFKSVSALIENRDLYMEIAFLLWLSNMFKPIFVYCFIINLTITIFMLYFNCMIY